MSRDDCVMNAAAYVLGALEPDEGMSYESHLETCAACRDELSRLQGVADVLPMASPQYRLPRGLRRRVVRSVHAESRGATVNECRLAVTRLVRRAPSLRPVMALTALAAVVAATIVVAITVSGGPTSPRLIPATVTGSTATAELRISDSRAELIVHRLPRPAAGRIYEIWLERPKSTPTPTGALFSVTAGGAADVGIPGELRGVRTVLVTQEPAGGSRVPTGPPVIVAPTS